MPDLSRRKCFLHIGTHKTGTTAIQCTLDSHRVELAGKGFLYPHTGLRAGNPGHHNIASELDERPEFNAQYGTLDDLIEEISGPAHHVILSSERFYFLFSHFARLNSLIDRLKRCGLRVVIVVYFRNTPDFFRSAYFEMLKHGYSAPFRAFLSEMAAGEMLGFGKAWGEPDNVIDTLQRLAADTDIEVVVRSYDRAASCIVVDFLSILGLTLADLGLQAESRINRRAELGESFSLFFRNWKGHPADDGEARFISSRAAALADMDIHVSNPTRQMLSAKYAAQNEFLKSHYGLVELVNAAGEPGHSVATRKVAPNLDDVFSITMARFIVEAGRRLAAEQTMFTRAHEQAIAERDALLQAHHSSIAERDGLLQARNALIDERDGLARTRDNLIGERDNLTKARDAAAHHAAMLASRSWRLTAPLQRLRTKLKGAQIQGRLS
jgi:hypothetical protein